MPGKKQSKKTLTPKKGGSVVIDPKTKKPANNQEGESDAG